MEDRAKQKQAEARGWCRMGVKADPRKSLLWRGSWPPFPVITWKGWRPCLPPPPRENGGREDRRDFASPVSGAQTGRL